MTQQKTILDKAREVAAEYYKSIGMGAIAHTLEIAPKETIVYNILLRLRDANLLAREPKTLTDEELMIEYDRLSRRSTSTRQDRIDLVRWVLATAYPDFAAMGQEIAEAKEKIADQQSFREQDQAALEELGQIAAKYKAQRDQLRNDNDRLRGELAMELDSDESTIEERDNLQNAGEEVMRTLGWKGEWGVGNDDKDVLCDSFENEGVSWALAAIKQLKTELATALDAREKRVCELLAKLDRGEDRACVELYSDRTVQIANADGDILDVQATGLEDVIAALETLTAEKQPETTPEEIIARVKSAAYEFRSDTDSLHICNLIDLAERQAAELYELRSKLSERSNEPSKGAKP